MKIDYHDATKTARKTNPRPIHDKEGQKTRHFIFAELRLATRESRIDLRRTILVRAWYLWSCPKARYVKNILP